jgi:hypothetical protein
MEVKEIVIIRDSAQELIDAGMRVKNPEEVIASRDITCFNGNTTERKLWFRRDKGTATDLLNIMMQEVSINIDESDTEEEIISRVYQTIKKWKELVKTENIKVDF